MGQTHYPAPLWLAVAAIPTVTFAPNGWDEGTCLLSGLAHSWVPYALCCQAAASDRPHAAVYITQNLAYKPPFSPAFVAAALKSLEPMNRSR